MSDQQRAQPQDARGGYARVAQAVVGDVGRVGKSGADALLPGGGPDANRTSRAAMIQHVRDAWPYPDQRQAIFARMVPSVPNPVAHDPEGTDKVIPARNGLQYWEDLIKAAFPIGWPEPAPMLAPTMPPMAGGVPGPMTGGFSPAPTVAPAPLAGEQTLGGGG